MKNNKTEPIPVMDYRQYRRARKLVHECCNYIAGNCIALDDGEECICVQSISYSIPKEPLRRNPMSDNRKYYYLKLKENYFDDDSIVLLESMQDGVLYSNILLKLYLKSLKHGGRLQLDEDIPYTAQMIATITRQQIGTVERALQIFLKLGLVEVLDSGTFYMSNIELLIGQSSTEAERKRAARLQNKALSALRTSGGHLSDIRPPEIEIELEKEIEIKREIEKVRPETGHPSHTYGRYQNVFLTDEELADLQVSFPAVWEQYIEKLSEYMASTGKRYQSHAATIRRWAGEDAKKTVTPSRNRDYSVKEDETV